MYLFDVTGHILVDTGSVNQFLNIYLCHLPLLLCGDAPGEAGILEPFTKSVLARPKSPILTW